ncbi:MAG TPA: SBBP repeat-containing protein, partial [Bacteroidia bacterium]|nr:SBBP repeat-containing protein [Bacteroidia bacterium]
MKRLLLIPFISLVLAVSANAQQKAMPVKGDALEFIPNKGQFADMSGKVRNDVLFYAASGNAQIYLRNSGISYVVSKVPPKAKIESKDFVPDTRIIKGCRIDMDFVGSSVPSTETTFPTEGYMNFYYAHCPDGILGVKSYNNVKYKSIYNNIDIAFYGAIDKGLEYDMIVNPGGSVSDIQMHYSGAERVELKDGKLRIITPDGNVTEYMPAIYQEINGVKVNIEGSYKLLVEEKTGEVTIGLKIKHYDKSAPLIIDPWWSTYLGGMSAATGDDVYGNAFDNAGNLFVAGATQSSTFPTTAGVFQSAFAGGTDAFVFKFSPTGGRIWATFYGGSGEDDGRGIAVDPADNVYVDGITNSSNFPCSAGAFQTTLKATGFAAYNAFIFRLNNTGGRVFGTYYGGDGTTQGYGITVDGNDNGIFVGYTSSSNLPVSGGAFQAANGGVYDGFCSTFNSAGAQVWGTYIGGSADDRAFGVAVDNANNVFIGGNSTSTNFPVTPGCYQSTMAGGGGYGDAFVFKFDNTGARQWATYIGGTGDDAAHGIAVDGNNDAIITGMTLSSNFPVTGGAYETTNTMITKVPSARADFVSKFSNSGTLKWSTYYNVATENGAMSIAVDNHNRIYVDDDMEVSGSTPLVPSNVDGCGFEDAFTNTSFNSDDPEEQFITKFNPAGFPICETFVGRAGENDLELYIKNISVSTCQMAVGGFTDSPSFPVSSGAFQKTNGNSPQTGFVTELSIFLCGDTNHSLAFTDTLKGPGCAFKMNFYSSICDTADTIGITYAWSFPGASPSSGTGAVVKGITYPGSGTYPVTVKILGGCTLGVLDSITKNVNISNGFSVNVIKTNPATCGAFGSASAFPTGGTSPYTYNWSNGATTQ